MLLVLTKLSNSQGSWKNDLSGLWYISENMPSWNGKFSLKSILISGLIFVPSWTLWNSWHRHSCWLGWAPVSWIWIEGNVFEHRTSVNHFIFRIGYWLCQGCGMHLVVILDSIFDASGISFLEFWCLSDSLINGRLFSSFLLFPDLCMVFFLWDFITF